MTAVESHKAELLLGIAVRVAWFLEIDPAVSEDAVMASARQLVKALRTAALPSPPETPK